MSLGTHGTIDDGAKHKRMNEAFNHAVTLRKRANVRPSPPSSRNQGSHRCRPRPVPCPSHSGVRSKLGTSCKWSHGQLPHMQQSCCLIVLVSLWTPINVYGRLYCLSQSLFATDIIYHYLALAPVPYLSHAFSVSSSSGHRSNKLSLANDN